MSIVKQNVWPNTWHMRCKNGNIAAPFDISLDRRCSAATLSDPIKSAHWHDFVQVWYTISGTYNQTFCERTLELSEGSLLIVPPFISHATHGEKDSAVTLACIDLPLDFLESIIPHPDMLRTFILPFQDVEKGTPHITLTGQAKERADMLFSQFAKLFEENPHKTLILHRDKLCELIEFISTQVKLATKDNFTQRELRHLRLMAKALTYIEQHYKEPIHLESLCRHTVLSRTDFCRIFKQYTGNTFKEYLVSRRLAHALNALINTDKSVMCIMQECGFTTKSNFNNLFRSFTGMTPREFRTFIRNYNSTVLNLRTQSQASSYEDE